MKYMVAVEQYNGDTYTSPPQSKQAAIRLARQDAKGSVAQVYIAWFRKQDGQHGYLNPDGNHAITGQPW